MVAQTGAPQLISGCAERPLAGGTGDDARPRAGRGGVSVPSVGRIGGRSADEGHADVGGETLGGAADGRIFHAQAAVIGCDELHGAADRGGERGTEIGVDRMHIAITAEDGKRGGRLPVEIYLVTAHELVAGVARHVDEGAGAARSFLEIGHADVLAVDVIAAHGVGEAVVEERALKTVVVAVGDFGLVGGIGDVDRGVALIEEIALAEVGEDADRGGEFVVHADVRLKLVDLAADHLADDVAGNEGRERGCGGELVAVLVRDRIIAEAGEGKEVSAEEGGLLAEISAAGGRVLPAVTREHFTG